MASIPTRPRILICITANIARTVLLNHTIVRVKELFCHLLPACYIQNTGHLFLKKKTKTICNIKKERNKQINCLAGFQMGLSEKLLICLFSSQELDCSTATGAAAFPPLSHRQDQKAVLRSSLEKADWSGSTCQYQEIMYHF